MKELTPEKNAFNAQDSYKGMFSAAECLLLTECIETGTQSDTNLSKPSKYLILQSDPHVIKLWPIHLIYSLVIDGGLAPQNV